MQRFPFTPERTSAAAVVGFLIALPLAAFAQERPKGAPTPPAHAERGRLLQELKAFDNPESAIFSDDGRYVFVSNAAELGMADKGFHWTEKGGFISKLSVQPDGTLKMVERKLVSGLTAPLGMAINPVATKKFPKGAIFLCTGGLPLASADGTQVKSASRLASGIVVFDVDGNSLGKLAWNAGSLLAKASGAPATLPNALGFDKQGNLYIAETGLGGASLEPKLDTRPGVLMIAHDALDAVAANEAPASPLAFMPMPGGPDGLGVSPVDGTIQVNTVGQAAGLPDKDKGGMWKFTKADLMEGKLPKAFSSNWGALDGLVFTSKGTRLDTQILPPNYITVVQGGTGKVQSLSIEGLERDLAGPADIALHTRADGTTLLLIPELMATSPNRDDNSLLVVKLPSSL